MSDTPFKITFRFARPEDTQYFYNLMLAEKKKVPKQLGLYGFDRDIFSMDNYKGVFVALRNEEAVAYGRVISTTVSGFNYIALFYVIPKYRRQGIGSKLFNFLEEYAFTNWNAKGVEIITIDNPIMDKLVKKRGFSLSGIYKKNLFVNGKWYNQSRWYKLYK